MFSADENRVKSSEVRGIGKNLVPERHKGDGRAFAWAQKQDKVKRQDALSCWRRGEGRLGMAGWAMLRDACLGPEASNPS